MSTAISHVPQRVETIDSDKPNFAKQYFVDSGPEKVLPEATLNHEAVRAEALDDEGVSCPMAYSVRDDFELLRILYEKEVSAETI